MPLPSTGQLSLDDIQDEFGGSNPISLSEYYAGGARVSSGTQGINGAIPSSGAISLSHFRGAPVSSLLDTDTVTSGTFTDFVYYHGYRGSFIGSIANGQFAPKSNATISELYYYAATGAQGVVFILNGNHTNSGWTTMKIGSTTFTRASAGFSQAGGTTQWAWGVSSNPFGPDGVGTAIEWNS